MGGLNPGLESAATCEITFSIVKAVQYFDYVSASDVVVTIRIKVSSRVEQRGQKFQPYGEFQPRAENITCNRKRNLVSL